MQPNLSAETYVRTLARFYGFYHPLEKESFGRERRKADELAADLSYFQIDPLSLPDCPYIPELDIPAKALGCMYVTEGATLGGQIIARHVRRVLHLNEDGCLFFSSYGAEVGRMWRLFRQTVEQHAAPDWHDEMVESARDF